MTTMYGGTANNGIPFMSTSGDATALLRVINKIAASALM